MTPSHLRSIAERVSGATGLDLRLDVDCEVALFVPDDSASAIRPNAALTKVIVTVRDGSEVTYWPGDHTINEAARKTTAAALLARATLVDDPDAQKTRASRNADQERSR